MNTTFNKFSEKYMTFVKYNINNDEWSGLYTFDKETIPPYVTTILSVNFINDTLGFSCGQLRIGPGSLAYDLIYRTKDGGNNWDLVLKSYEEIPSGLQDISFYDEKNGIAVGQYGKIYLTKDGGNNWILSKLPDEYNMDTFLTMVVAWAGQHPIIGTWADGIFRYEGDFFDFTPDTTDVEEYIKNILGEIEVKVHLKSSQLYVSINDEQFRKYRLQVCDIICNVVKELELSSGVGTLYVPYDISDLTSGAYFYMISQKSFIVKTGKIIKIEK